MFRNEKGFIESAAGNNFTAIKQKHDKGGDGILNGDSILAVYGPESYTLVGFKTKIGDDYKSYAKNWRKTHPNWVVVFNDDFLANMINFVDSKHAGAVKVGLTELVQMIEELPWSKIQRVTDYLGIPTELLVNNLIDRVVNDLITIDASGNVTSQRPRAVYIEDKIALNYSKKEVQQATDEYYNALEYFDTTEAILRDHTTMEVSGLRGRILADFNALGGVFVKKFRGLLDRYCHSHPSDDLYRFAVTVILTFFFEQCLIGAKAEGEVTC